jgi:hypothetical protein
VRSTFDEDWPREIQERVLARWSSDYGYPAARPEAAREG